MTRPSQYTVRKLKYNGDLWGTFGVYVLAQRPTGVVAWEPRGTFIHRHQGWKMRYDHLQYFYPDRGYVISADYGNNGILRHCYCDIAMPWSPPVTGDRTLSFVDLELDLLAQPSGHYLVHDRDEFERAVVTMAYPPEVRDGAQAALERLIAAAISWEAPFDSLPRVLPRMDLHLLETDDPHYRAALAALGL